MGCEWVTFHFSGYTVEFYFSGNFSEKAGGNEEGEWQWHGDAAVAIGTIGEAAVWKERATGKAMRAGLKEQLFRRGMFTFPQLFHPPP